ncbi:hypothetical protein DLAC_02716 [Tieghemostelium lacteum]|uniref:Ankyrin repeat-containing protein n=1 Tax=Tieghemostelium lacteum TaxID=361077 RepID=A0A152A3K3_TIELA|nr:hypothetical protein DLAC_02716 [Tieghemostelium lacteum]|eukprot:KYR00677.1 hypothetical protein DLAC_02716 [Tieghemostelium lacteum]
MSYILYQQVFQNKYLFKKIFSFIKQYHRENNVESYNYYNLPIDYYIPKENVQYDVREKMELLRDRIQVHLEWLNDGKIEKIIDFDQLGFFYRFYERNEDFDMFKLIFDLLTTTIGYSVNQLFFRQNENIFSSPNQKIIEYIIQQYPLAIYINNLRGGLEIEDYIHPDLDYKWLIDNLQLVKKNSNINNLKLLTRSLLSKTKDNMMYMMNTYFESPLYKAMVLGIAIRMAMHCDKLEYFKILVGMTPKTLDKCYIPNTHYFEGHTNVLTSDQMKMLKMFYDHFDMEEYRYVFSIPFVLSYPSDEAIRFLEKFSNARDNIMNFFSIPNLFTRSSVENLRYMVKHNLIDPNNLLYYPKVLEDIELFRLMLGYFKSSQCLHLINCISLETLKMVIEETNLVVNDSYLKNSYNGKMENLKYLYEQSLVHPDRVKITDKSLTMAYQEGNIEMVKFLRERQDGPWCGTFSLYNILHKSTLSELTYFLSIPEIKKISGFSINNTIDTDKLDFLSQYYPLDLKNVLFNKKLYCNSPTILGYILQNYTKGGCNGILSYFKIRHILLLEKSATRNNFKYIHFLLENRDHPLLKNQMRLNHCPTLIKNLLDSNYYKMIITLFHHQFFKFKHLHYFTKSNNLQIIRMILLYYKNNTKLEVSLSNRKFKHFYSKFGYLINIK